MFEKNCQITNENEDCAYCATLTEATALLAVPTAESPRIFLCGVCGENIEVAK